MVVVVGGGGGGGGLWWHLYTQHGTRHSTTPGTHTFFTHTCMQEFCDAGSLMDGESCVVFCNYFCKSTCLALQHALKTFPRPPLAHASPPHTHIRVYFAHTQCQNFPPTTIGSSAYTLATAINSKDSNFFKGNTLLPSIFVYIIESQLRG